MRSASEPKSYPIKYIVCPYGCVSQTMEDPHFTSQFRSMNCNRHGKPYQILSRAEYTDHFELMELKYKSLASNVIGIRIDDGLILPFKMTDLIILNKDKMIRQLELEAQWEEEEQKRMQRIQTRIEARKNAEANLMERMKEKATELLKQYTLNDIIEALMPKATPDLPGIESEQQNFNGEFDADAS